MIQLKEKVIFITGASSGFGEITATKLVAEGCKVILGARRVEKLATLAEKLGPENVAFQEMDVTKIDDVRSIVKIGLDKFGVIDGLVNNAGIMPLSMIASGRTKEWDQMIDVNVKGVLYAINAVLEHMLKRGHGKIVNVSSIAGQKVFPASAVYSGTKFAVRAISEGLRIETAGKIQVTNISPGAFATELGNSINDAAIKDSLGAYEKIVQPAEHVADAIIFALKQPPNVAINELTIRPTAQEL